MAALVFSLVFCTTSHASAVPQVAIGAIRPAVVLVYLPLDNVVGSGVVARTGAGGTDIVTAAHVVRGSGTIDVYFDDDLSHPHKATVVKTDSDLDLAVLHTSDSASSQAAFADAVSSGEQVAVLGYPAATSVKLAARTNELRAEATIGSVTGVREHGTLVSTNVYTEPGDSGAPLFRQENAQVVGIVTGHFGRSSHLGYQATGVAAIRHFLASAGVSYYGGSGSTGTAHASKNYSGIVGMKPLHDVAGARRFAFLVAQDITAEGSSSSGDLNNTNSLMELAQGDVAAKIPEVFRATLSQPQYSTNQTDQSDAAALAARQGDVAAVKLAVFGRVMDGGLINSVGIVVQVTVVDRYGNIAFFGLAKRTQQRPMLPFTASDVSIYTGKATEDALNQIEKQVPIYGTDSAINFARFGIPIGTGKKNAFFALRPDPHGARVAAIASYGTASRAQLQMNDVVTEINGQDLKGLSADQLDALVAATPPIYRCTILSPDGDPIVIAFQPQDIRWYLEHPLK